MQTIARTFLFLAASATCSTALPAQQQWTQLAQVTPPPAAGAAMAYDVLHDRTVWFGGREQLTGWPVTFHAQTWLFDGTVWTQANPTSQPPARAHHAMVGNDNGQVLLFGGVDANGTPLNDLWRWDGSDWTNLTTSTAPPPRSQAAMASYGSGVLVFGGYDDFTGTTLADTWLWSPQTGWSLRNPGPSLRRNARMVELGNLNVMLHGGHDQGPLADTWLWNNSNWTEVTGAAGPARSGFAIGYDPASGQAFLSGGHHVAGPTGFGADLWRFDGSIWRDITPNTQPSPVLDAAFTLDTVRHRLMVVGGNALTQTSDEHWQFESTFPVTHFGTGCARIGTVPLVHVNSAALGSTLQFSVAGNGQPLPFGMIALGFDRQNWNGTSLPLSLQSLGLSCDLLVAPEFVQVASIPTSIYHRYLSIPDVPALRGATIYLQGAALDANGLRAVTDAAAALLF